MTSRDYVVRLPSGRRVRARVDRGARIEATTQERRLMFGEARAAIARGLTIEDVASKARIVDLDALPLADFHVLRDLAIRTGLVPSEPEDVPCDNCDAVLRFDGASLPADDLVDRYEDEPAAAGATITLPEPIATASGEITRVRLRPVTLGEATPLHRELARDRPFRITPGLVRAMGLERLEGAKAIVEPRAMARALEDASDESWSAVEAAFLSLAYPASAISPLVCAACETVHEMEVPWPRELEPGQYQPRREEGAPFPSAEAFEDHVVRVAKTVFDRMDVGGMTLRVSPGVAEVDAGGVPMLGSYGPETNDVGATEFVVTLYYRTFERAFRDDARFDWAHEVEETLEHEVQHHPYYLDGHDPMDEEERRETAADAVRRAGGKARLAKLERNALAKDAWAIVRVLGPILLGIGVLVRCAS